MLFALENNCAVRPLLLGRVLSHVIDWFSRRGVPVLKTYVICSLDMTHSCLSPRVSLNAGFTELPGD